jgi:hypothetical protein
MPGGLPDKKITIIGGGIIGMLEAYFAYLKAKETGESIKITVYEKNSEYEQTTSAKIPPSLTPDEIIAVVPRGNTLVEKLKVPFNTPGGIRVSDVAGVNESPIAQDFIAAVLKDSENQAEYEARTQRLLELGKESMLLWQEIYDNADIELKQIMNDSNFNSCREPRKPNNPTLHDGYRIDLIQGIPNAPDKAKAMIKDYEKLGYKHCAILTPHEVIKRDNALIGFCFQNSHQLINGDMIWKNDAVALWRPGGCIYIHAFLPKFSAYLSKAMGQYIGKKIDVPKNNFQYKFGHHVTEMDTKVLDGRTVISDLSLKLPKGIKWKNNQKYKENEYIICPGESVGTLRRFQFDEPAYAIFAGATLKLNIPLATDVLKRYEDLNHCMEVHQEGVVLAWQARVRDRKIFIAVAGTKAFYGDKIPSLDQQFAQDRTVLQLNVINSILPEFLSIALGKDTAKTQLTESDMKFLEREGIAKRDVGSRAVYFDNLPSLGRVFKNGVAVENARVTTGLGSGGVSFAPAAVRASMSADSSSGHDILKYTQSTRKPGASN